MNLTELSRICIKCIGAGGRNGEPCRYCEGYGHTLTETGIVLIEFLKSRGIAFPMSPLAEYELPSTEGS